MGRSRIEWVRNEDDSQGYTINPVKGLCPMACSYCYARKIYKRFKWNPEIRYDVQPLLDIEKIKKPSRIFVGSTMELFGEWVDAFWLDSIFKTVKAHPQHTFIFLTKQPWNLPDKFPPNCWVLVSVDGTDNAPLGRMLYTKFDRIQASVKGISFEPLLADPKLDYRDLEWVGISWVIIGQKTPPSKSTSPKMEWIDEIEDACRKAGIPFFEKFNLKELLNRTLVHTKQYPQIS